MSRNNNNQGQESEETIEFIVTPTLNEEFQVQIQNNGIMQRPLKAFCDKQSEFESDKVLLDKQIILNQKLPQEMLRHIFGYCDDKMLLTNRLVCKNWKLAFDNSSNIIGKFVFDIYDWRTFNESTIVDCVKSIRIYKAWKWNEENPNWLEFCTRIGKSVRNIIFDFVMSKSEQKNMKEYIIKAFDVARSLLLSCQQLDELQILNGAIVRCWAFGAAPNPVFTMPFYGSVRTLVLVVVAYEDPNNLKELLAKYPNVKKLQMTQQTGASLELETDMNIMLCEYIKANNGSLKEIQLEGFGIYSTHVWLKFVFTAANYNIKLTFLNSEEDKSQLNVHAFLNYVPTEDAPINEKTCRLYEKATLYIPVPNPPMPDLPDTSPLGYCTNIKDFGIVFARPAVLEELGFPRLAGSLKTLHLIDNCELNDHELQQQDPDAIILCPAEAFDCGFPALQNLKLNGDLFGPRTAETFSSFFFYFPNLQRISIASLFVVIEHMFVHLSKLELLEEMDLRFLDQLTDQIFTELCESQRPAAAAAEGGIEFVPAITAFNRLKKLRINDCALLTDICVIEGIALNQSLTFVSYDALTNVGIEAMTNVGFSVNQAGDLVRTINNTN